MDIDPHREGRIIGLRPRGVGVDLAAGWPRRPFPGALIDRLLGAGMRVKRDIRLGGRSSDLAVRYGISNQSAQRRKALFIMEWNLALKDALVNRPVEIPRVSRFSVSDPALRCDVSWAFNRSARLSCLPVEAGSGPRRFLGTRFVFAWPLDLPPGRAWDLACGVHLGRSS
ncbi:MAG: hypothetical protein NC819_02235 [Candidatus Omnitrophica bacterium]|nr:hypothetical protein [Candidatus Omnitrophota bacterium]